MTNKTIRDTVISTTIHVYGHVCSNSIAGLHNFCQHSKRKGTGTYCQICTTACAPRTAATPCSS